MSVPYQKLVAEIGLRLNAIAGALPADLETTYIKTTLSQTDFKSGDWPYTLAKDLVILAEGKYAGIISFTNRQSLRKPLISQTAAFASGVAFPATNSAGDKVIGVPGAIKDAVDSTTLTEKPLALVRRLNAETWRVYPLYHFAFDGDRLEHTRTTVIADVCTYNSATQRAAVQASGNMLLADSLEEALICEGVSMAFRDDNFPAQAKQYRDYSNQEIGRIQEAS